MPSTLTSKSPILTVQNLNLSFQVDLLEPKTFRGAFTQFFGAKKTGGLSQRKRVEIAKNLSFEVFQGERVGILGANGVGKTSLCRCIAGMYVPHSGKITVEGSLRAIFNTQVGIQPELTGRENALLLASLMYPEIEDIDSLVEEALEFSELAEFVNAPYRIYSNGMQARLCLSVISARPTSLLILDEVFDGADQFFRQKIEARVLKMIESSGAALFVSHSADQVVKVCNRVIVLNQGQMVFDGSVEEGIRFYQG